VDEVEVEPGGDGGAAQARVGDEFVFERGEDAFVVSEVWVAEGE
jgi:hypothetical protein